MTKLIALPIALLITGSALVPLQVGPADHEPIQNIAAAAPIGLVSSPPEARLDTTVTVHNAGADQSAAIDDALARFHNNGLDLPDIDIWFSNDSADCKGHYGLFQPRVEPKRITVCNNYDFVLTHELAHLLVNEATFNCFAGLDPWLSEGLAVYSEGPVSKYFQNALAGAITGEQLISVRSLSSSFPAAHSGAILSYAQSQSLVEFLIDTYGWEKMRRLLSIFKDGSTTDKALRTVYGFDRDGLNQQWKQHIGAK